MRIERCKICDEPTGRAGRLDDSLYLDAGDGPYCEHCFKKGDPVNDWDKLVIEKAIAEALIEAAGMTAENMQRQAKGASMAYDDKAFFDVIGRLNATFETHRP